MKAVIDFVLGAGQERMDYYSVEIKDGEILSFKIDECMVMAEKTE